MKIKRLHFNQLRNNEHFQCHTEFKNLVDKSGSAKTDPIYINEYLPLYAQEDEALMKITKNSFTDLREDADRQRDSIFRGMVDLNNSCLNHFDDEIKTSSERLKILFDTYGNLAKMPLQEETSAITNLIQELRGNYAADAQKTKIDIWADKLEEYNNAYQQLVESGYEEDAAQTDLKAKLVRADIDKVFRRIIERIEALMLIEGEEPYADFVKHLNVQLEKYANILEQRKGRKKNDDEEKQKQQ